MIIIKKKYEHKIADNFEIEITIDHEVNYRLFIVYYVNCMINDNYFNWIENQLSFVKGYGGKIYVMCTIEKEKEEEVKEKIKNCFPEADITVECNSTNQYEYPGIKKVWDLSQIYNQENDIIMYFHSKGLTHFSHYNEAISLLRSSKNCEEIIKDIDRIYEIFSFFPSIEKITTTSGGIGWGWYNYWVARGSYLCKVEKPIITARYHYYEDWLARKIPINSELFNDVNENRVENINFSLYENTLKECYQLYCEENTGNIGYCMILEPGYFNDVYISEHLIPRIVII
jgi:hypothetical protein